MQAFDFFQLLYIYINIGRHRIICLGCPSFGWFFGRDKNNGPKVYIWGKMVPKVYSRCPRN